MKPKKPSHHKKKPHRGKPAGGHVPHGHLPEVCVLVITGQTEDGELIGAPLKWDAQRKPPHIIVTESGRGTPANKGDRVLAKLRKVKPHLYQALVIRVLPADEEKTVLGVFVTTSDGGIIEPVSRKNKESYMVARADMNGARHGDLVSAISLPGVPSLSMSYAKITECLGRMDSPRAASLIAAQMHNLPSTFSKEALAEAEAAEVPVMHEGRTDLRKIPLVTIDGEDARDFDDAVFAEREDGGFHLIVAIADVAHYVKEGSALDAGAFERGNSVYFPDRVIPMLPERLSNGLCSLVPGEDRYCLAVHLWIDEEGNTKRYRFERGLMRSHARLTYTQVETSSPSPLAGEGRDGGAVDKLQAHGESPHPNLPPQGGKEWLANLWTAYAALAKERDRRGALNLNLPEFKILFDKAGNVEAIVQKPQLEAHRLIESYMIAANVAAADYLLKHNAPGIYRVHETPSEEKLTDLQNLLKMAGYALHVGAGIKAAHFNRVLKASEDRPDRYLIHTSVLRSQMQAYYAHKNLGHFGLSLQKYCHFTSPIRRYSDLVVHRSLAQLVDNGLRMTDDEKSKKLTRHPSSVIRHPTALPEVALHISDTERRAMMAERDASDRYKVSFMSRHTGSNFEGIIGGLNEYGLFVTLNGNGITGFVPMRNLTGDFFHYDKKHACFKAQRSQRIYAMGQPLMVRVQTANAITGSLIFEPVEGSAPPELPLRPKHPHRHKSRKR